MNDFQPGPAPVARVEDSEPVGNHSTRRAARRAVLAALLAVTAFIGLPVAASAADAGSPAQTQGAERVPIIWPRPDDGGPEQDSVPIIWPRR
jgi:hypothetical protein